ncbi:MAG: PTS sugar transporter subunit IIA [bacterium]|nr:PTS sugar transporter subunit IIA [bacterium]
MLSIINENLVIINTVNKTKNDIIKDMVHLLHKEKRITDKTKFYNEILQREKIQSTGIGEAIAIPHAKSNFVRLMSVVICISKKGIHFKSLDDKPVKIIFLVAAPKEFTKSYLQIIAKIARLLKNTKWRERFLNASEPEEMIELIREFDRVYPDRLKIDLINGDKALLKS